MLARRFARLMTSTLRHSIFGGPPGYTPLSANSSSSNSSSNRRNETCGEGLCSDPYSVCLHRLDALRNFACGHLPSLGCLFLAAYRISLQQSNWLFSSFVAVAMLGILFCGLVHAVENFFIYAPKLPERSRFYTEVPQSKDFPEWRLVRLQSTSAWGRRSQTLKCFLILQEDAIKRATAPTILFMHGNAGNIGHRLPLAQVLYNICDANIFLLEYRGFGASGGCPSELGTYADAMAAFDYLAGGADGEIDGRNIFLFGRSLGGAVVIDLATRPEVSSRLRGTIVENSFCSISGMGHSICSNFLGPLTKFCLPTCMVANRYDSLKKLKTRPLDENAGKFLFLSSQKDEVVPPSMMDRLAGAWAVATNRPTNLDSPSWVFDDPNDFIERGKEGLVRFAKGCHASTWTCKGFNKVVQRFVSLHTINKLVDPIPTASGSL